MIVPLVSGSVGGWSPFLYRGLAFSLYFKAGAFVHASMRTQFNLLESLMRMHLNNKGDCMDSFMS